MSRDFAPRDHWIANMAFPDLYFSNMKMSFGEKEWWVFTEKQLDDRKAHKYIAVLGADIFDTLRYALSDEEFKKLNNTLGELVEADVSNKTLAAFPKEMVDWFYNNHNHYYHEPNDEEFLGYIRENFKSVKQCKNCAHCYEDKKGRTCCNIKGNMAPEAGVCNINSFAIKAVTQA